MRFLKAVVIVFSVAIFGNWTNGLFAGSSFLLDTTAFYLLTEGSAPTVASDGANFLAVWDDVSRGGIYGTRITGAGVLLDSSGIEIGQGDFYPCVEFNGTCYLVVWELSEGSRNIYAARVTTGGQVLDPSGIPICTATGHQRNARIASNGSGWLVCWEDERNGGASTRDIYGARVNADGQVLDPDGFPISTAANRQVDISVVFGGSNYFVVWDDSRNSDSVDVYGARINQSGNVLDPSGILICSAANSQFAPSVAFDGTNYFVVWSDDRLALWSTDIYGTRVNQSGTVLDPGGISLFNGANWEEYTAIEFDGTNYLVTWEDYRTGHADIYGGRVTPAVIVLDTGGFSICTASEEQYNNSGSLAFNGSCFLNVWEDERNDPSSAWHIYAARINTAGTVLDPTNFCISLKTNEQFAPAAVFDGTNYFAVWEESKNGTRDIYGARYNASGVMLSPGIIAISTAAYDQKNPAVSFDGTNYFVVWQDNRTGSNYGIYGARVDQSGTVLDPSSIAIHWGGYAKEYPDLVFDGSNYLIVYQTYRSGYNMEIYGIKVNQAGAILTPGGFDISLGLEDEYYPNVAFDGTHYLVVWADNRSSNYDILGTRVDTSGVVMDSSGIVVNREGFRPALAYTGNRYFVVWEEEISAQEFQIFGTQVDISGTVLDTAGINISNVPGMNTRPAVATDNSKFVVVWENYAAGGYLECDIRGAHVNTSGIVTNSFIISNEAKRQSNPFVAHGAADRFLIAYEGWCNDYNGKSYHTYRAWGRLVNDTIGISEQHKARGIPTDYRLFQNYPNPFSRVTEIRYQIADIGNVSLKVYDVLGREVATLVNEMQTSGKYSITWDASKMPNGIYLARLKTGIFEATKKMLVLR